MQRERLAIVCSHPIQYYSPWFSHIAASGAVELRVYYLWEFGAKSTRDREFGRAFKWDVPLLDGHDHEFVQNVSTDPGTHHFGGLDNPSLFQRIAEFAPAAVVTLGYNYKSIVRLLLRKRALGVPMILRGDSHLIDRPRSLAQSGKALLRGMLLRRYDHYLCVGEANRKYLVSHGVQEDRMSFCPHSVNNEWFAARGRELSAQSFDPLEDLGIPAGRAVVLFAGKLIKKKRPDLLLAAFMGLHGHETALVFCGDGEMAAELQQQAGGASGVHFIGFRNQSEMPALYRRADLLVLPSQGNSETWGLCVNEAFCMGTPALVSDHVGCHFDLIKPGVTGDVFSAGDVDDLTTKLRALLSDRAGLRTMGENARELVSHYSYEQSTAGLLEALGKLRASRTAARA